MFHVKLFVNGNSSKTDHVLKRFAVHTFSFAVKRNIARFPSDFMFQLSKEEWENLIFQNGISSKQHGGRRSMPYVFSEQGVAMLAAVLNSQKAIVDFSKDRQ